MRSSFAGNVGIMPRPRRVFIADVSIHVIERGHNHMTVFYDEDDYASYLALLERMSMRYGVAVNAFALMSTHTHFIASPADAAGLPNMMKDLGGSYARHFNRRYKRIGTPWNGRYRGLLIHDERYWLTCLRYVEQNPVRAGIVASPDDYRWSSYPAHARGEWPEWLTPHRVYLALGSSAEERQIAYRAICGIVLTAQEMASIRRPVVSDTGQTPRPSEGSDTCQTPDLFVR
jgi:putative transposase